MGLKIGAQAFEVACRACAGGVKHRDHLRYSSQAKGRVERVNRTLQDRLVKELRLENVSSIEAGNAFLTGFVSRFNERFAVRPAKPTTCIRHSG